MQRTISRIYKIYKLYISFITGELKLRLYLEIKNENINKRENSLNH